jgi:F420-non-reducing hydrogenase small subunit
MSLDGRSRIAMYWASSCGGCDISLLEVEPLLEGLAADLSIVFWPCIADFKYETVEKYPEGWIDLCFFNGGVRNSEQEEIARLLRRKSRTLISYGTCACDGGIPALANLCTTAEIFRTAYQDGPTNDNPEQLLPQTATARTAGHVTLPRLYPAVLRLSDVVPVDYEIPGCPPQADQIWEAIEAISSGAVPPANGHIRVGCSNKTVCDECAREKRLTKMKCVHRIHQFRPEAGWCLLEQGLLCMGPATRGGCGALCPSVSMTCEGCYGPLPGADDQGASMAGALGTLVDVETEKQALDVVSAIPDPTGTLYRFSMASGTLKFSRERGQQ